MNYPPHPLTPEQPEWIGLLENDDGRHTAGKAWVAQFVAAHPAFPANGYWPSLGYRGHLRALAAQEWTLEEIVQVTASSAPHAPYFTVLFGYHPIRPERTGRTIAALWLSDATAQLTAFAACSRSEVNGLPDWALDELVETIVDQPALADMTGAAATLLVYMVGATSQFGTNHNRVHINQQDIEWSNSVNPCFARDRYASTTRARQNALRKLLRTLPAPWSQCAALKDTSASTPETFKVLHQALCQSYPWTALRFAATKMSQLTECDLDATLAVVDPHIAGIVHAAIDLEVATDPIAFAKTNFYAAQGEPAVLPVLLDITL